MRLANAVALALVASSITVSDAYAQSAAAEALFLEGRKLVKAGKVEAGCDKLEASEALESSVGTLLNLGDCREKLGQTASAWAAFRKAEAMAKRAGNDRKRMLEARRRANKLEDSLASITIQVGPTSKAEGLTIRRNGEELDPATWGTALVVDPGSHKILVEAPGKKPWETEVSVGKGGKRWVVVPTLEAEPVPLAPEAPPAVAETPAPTAVVTTPVPADTSEPSMWTTPRYIAVGLAVAGAGALGGGIYFGMRARDLQDQSDAICPTNICDDPEGLRLNDDAQDAARNANIFLVAGGAAVGVATVMWFIGGPDEETVVAPTFGGGQVGASLTGRF